MVTSHDLAHELRERVNAHLEWLLVRESGRTFPLRRDEIDIWSEDDKVRLATLDYSGLGHWRVRALRPADLELTLELTPPFGTAVETVRLVPRTPARELSGNIELARLQRANLIGQAAIEGQQDLKLTRVALNHENGRLAQITVRAAGGKESALIADVTGTMTHEAVMSSAMLWSEKLRRRKKPVNDVWIAGEKKQARNLQKLHALFDEGVSRRFTIFEISNDATAPRLKALKRLDLKTLWRERTRRLKMPDDIFPSDTAASLMELSPERCDLIISKHGETVRFNGLPFARIRTVSRRENVWFGIDRDRRSLTEETREDLAALVRDLENYRSDVSANSRHEYYRATPEAWLESILRRDIRQLDANLILSPIYNQFRTAADKIDLLAIRRDGRLVIIEIKTSPDREMVFQAADYWRKIEIQRRRGSLKQAFPDTKILDKPALIYAVAPALSFHRDFGFFARALRSEIEIWRFELHERWRSGIKVLGRRDYRR